MKNITLFILLSIIAPFIMQGQELVKIEKELLQEMNTRNSESDKIRVNIILEEQYDPVLLRNKSALFQGREAKRRFVVDELKRFSRESQQELLNSIGSYTRSDDITDIRPFWIANIINCEASVEVLRQLAAHPGIRLIGFDREENVLFGKEESAGSGSRSRGMTYNITNVEADKVWAMGYTGEGVLVAVLDSGVNYRHDDIKDNMWEHPDYPYHGYDFVNEDNNPLDDRNHGTHCAGTIAGTGKAGTQTGIAPGATIMAIKILSSGGSATCAKICLGIEFAVEHGAHVLSLSLGFAGGGTESQRIQFREVMTNALEAGVIAAVAAGNEGEGYGQSKYPVPNNVRTPGNCPPPWLNEDQTEIGGTTAVLCVGATDAQNERIAISSIGPVTWQNISGYTDYMYNPSMGLIRPDICAPGNAITSISHTNNSGYLEMTGTSMATPCVAGIIALMLSRNPELTPAEVCELLEVTADNKPAVKNNFSGSGKANARKAVEAISDKVSIRLSEPEVVERVGNKDGKVNPGETITFSIRLENSGETSLTDIQAVFKTDEDVEIIKGISKCEPIGAGESLTIEDAFEIVIPSDFTKERLRYQIEVTTNQGKKVSLQALSVFDCKLTLTGTRFKQTADSFEITLFIKNTGNESIRDVQAVLSTTASGVVVEASDAFFGNFGVGQYKYRTFTATIDKNVTGSTIPFTLSFTDKTGRTIELPFSLKLQHTAIPTMCECPLSVNHEIEQGQIRLSWEPTGDNTPQSFAIYRNRCFLAETTAPVFSDTDVVGGKIVYSIEALFESGCTSEQTDYEVLMPCAIPVGFKAEAMPQYRIRLTWEAAGQGVHYNIYRNSHLLQPEIEELAYIDADVTEGQTYCYTVTTSCSGDVESEHSEQACETPRYVSIQDIEKPVNVYPNPTTGLLQITNSDSAIGMVRLFDLSGRLLMEKNSIKSSEYIMDISNLMHGLYILNVNGRIFKLMKQ